MPEADEYAEDMAWNFVSSLEIHCDQNAFHDAIDVWIHRPNVCSKIVSCATVELASKNPLLNSSNLKDLLDKLSLSGIKDGNIVTGCSSGGNHESSIEVLCRKLFPKNPSVHSTLSEVIVKTNFSVSFIPVSEDFTLDDQEIMYKIELISSLQDLSLQDKGQLLNKNHIYLHVFGDDCLRSSKTCAPTRQWLSEKFLPILVKWTENSKTSGENLPASLSLIPQNDYAPVYQNLKEKYGKKLAAMWQEATDPQKYVFEDIAIATYLIILWKQERKLKNIDKLQSFIDLGCGNGLLVHILNSEGHPGVGVDVRRRKIWDLYPETTILQERAVNPTANDKYEYDWLLGNHSDELTPWIPVLAAKSGFHVRYWILPCCFHDFFSKYERCKSTLSQYEDYLAFVKDIGEKCGFDVEVDVLRIPSTKRICHVGMIKEQPPQHQDIILQNVQSFIDGRKMLNDQFKARDRIEIVKNCTKMNQLLQNEIVNVIVAELLKTKNYVKITSTVITNHETVSQAACCRGQAATLTSQLNYQTCDGMQKSTSGTSLEHSDTNPDHSKSEPSTNQLLKENENHHLCMQTADCEITRLWNRGGFLVLEQAAGLLTDDMKMKMKKECGGLQTLLRNHHQVFDIANGKVSLRDWSSLHVRPKRKKRKGNRRQCVEKKSACWFFNYHPDGCPREEEHCPFLHDRKT